MLRPRIIPSLLVQDKGLVKTVGFSSPKYVGADEKVLLASMTGKFSFAEGDTRDTPEFNLFFNQQASYPFYSDGIWFLTQMRRWGQIAESPEEGWYEATAKSVYRPDLYEVAAKQLVDEGKLEASAVPFGSDGYKPANADFIDGMTYDPKHPAAYIDSLKIGLKAGETAAAKLG